MQLPCQGLSPKQPALAEGMQTHASWRSFQAAAPQMVKMPEPAAAYSLCQILRMQSMAEWYWMTLTGPSCSGGRTLALLVFPLPRLYGGQNVCAQ